MKTRKIFNNAEFKEVLDKLKPAAAIEITCFRVSGTGYSKYISTVKCYVKDVFMMSTSEVSSNQVAFTVQLLEHKNYFFSMWCNRIELRVLSKESEQ